MYAKSLSISNFKCFSQAQMDCQYPGRPDGAALALPNVNLVLGDNGGGKSSVLRALAIAVLGQFLNQSGFVPWRLVRRTMQVNPIQAELALAVSENQAAGEFISHEIFDFVEGAERLLETRLQRDISNGLDILHSHSRFNPATSEGSYFVIGYGATRRLEIGDYSESQARRTRGVHYGRVASLFEDHLALRPMQAWAPRLRNKAPETFTQVVAKLNQVLPQNVRFAGEFEDEDGPPIFLFNNNPTPLAALSDGYKSFIGWVADLIGQLAEVADGAQLDSVSGIVLLDEIDLHLHPAWQRVVVPNLAQAFPKLQFFFTSHSPLVAATVQHQNIFVTQIGPDGGATLAQLGEHVHGRSVEDLLLSSYFGLDTTRPEAFARESQSLFERAAQGDAQAALDFLQKLTGKAPNP
ncbi:AAA family ATPase [Massilia sp. W12]|uniref:AAA family ATPase n=1 Tax=Massilia sp. W12 TaxID=3126507 RepID=UPI0030CFFBBA